jgi:hypothetical protein
VEGLDLASMSYLRDEQAKSLVKKKPQRININHAMM